MKPRFIFFWLHRWQHFFRLIIASGFASLYDSVYVDSLASLLSALIVWLHFMLPTGKSGCAGLGKIQALEPPDMRMCVFLFAIAHVSTHTLPVLGHLPWSACLVTENVAGHFTALLVRLQAGNCRLKLCCVSCSSRGVQVAQQCCNCGDVGLVILVGLLMLVFSLYTFFWIRWCDSFC